MFLQSVSAENRLFANGFGCLKKREAQNLNLYNSSAMRKTKKPAIASEWRENKEAQERADLKAAREQARAARAEAYARFSGAAGDVVVAGGWSVCLALAVLFGLSLFTYSPADPGFSVTGTQKAANLCGILGAWSADFAYWLLGRSAWWVVAVLAFAGVQMVRALWARANTVQYRLRPWSAAVGFVVLLSASVGLETLQFGYAGLTLPLGAGGLYGQFVASQVTPFLGIWGSTFLFLLLTAIGLSLVFGFSWFDLAEKIGMTPVGLAKAANGNPTFETLEKIADGLGVTVPELFAPQPTNTITCPHCGAVLEIREKE